MSKAFTVTGDSWIITGANQKIKSVTYNGVKLARSKNKKHYAIKTRGHKEVIKDGWVAINFTKEGIKVEY